jgi:hypothetical protein
MILGASRRGLDWQEQAVLKITYRCCTRTGATRLPGLFIVRNILLQRRSAMSGARVKRANEQKDKLWEGEKG